MSLEPIGIVILLLGILVLFKDDYYVILLFVASTLLGSAAAVIINGAGGIQPAHLLLLFLSVCVLRRRAGLVGVRASLSFLRPGFWLVATALYGLLGAFFFPRMMAGQFNVNAIGSSAAAAGFTQIPFSPTTGNLTQSIYFIGDMVAYFACISFCGSEGGVVRLSNAMIVYSFLNICFALLDVATFYTGTTFLLDFIRNSSYAILTDATVGDLKRINGSFTESSSFAFATMGSFAFTFQLWLQNYKSRLAAFLSFLSLVLLLFSTSTTAYVALPAYLLTVYLTLVFKLLLGQRSKRAAAVVVMGPVVLVFLLSALMLSPISSSVMEFFDHLVLQKSNSDSGIERTRYNWEALQNFMDSYGLGTGIGSVRASSLLVATPASLGVVGGISFSIYVGLILFDRLVQATRSGVDSIQTAARSAALALIIAASISGATFDPGLPFFIFGALASYRKRNIKASQHMSLPFVLRARGELKKDMSNMAAVRIAGTD